jgi:uncharacterized protein YkwD
VIAASQKTLLAMILREFFSNLLMSKYRYCIFDTSHGLIMMRLQQLKSANISIIITLMFLPTLLACAPSVSKADRHALTNRPQPKIILSNLETRIHGLINNERRKHGLSPLKWDDTLSGIAKNHSTDMAKRNYFSHNSPEGHDFSYRYQQEAYSCAVPAGNIIYGGAENIFQNNLYDSITALNGKAFYDWNSSEKIAETTVQGWMKSPGHRRNILMPHWKHEGIGVFIAPDDKVYITQNFC